MSEKTKTPIISNALKEDNVHLLKNKLFFGYNINAKDKFKNSLLHLAIENGAVECVKLLIAKKAAVNRSHRNGDTELIIVLRIKNEFQQKREKIIKLLINVEEIDLKIKTWSEWNYLHFACSFGNLTEVMQDLYTVDGEGYYPIHRAIACGHIEVVKNLFNKYPQLDENMR
ncbi:serine/threonine-protein phosphatase 6 regulatory ankyrin repeat subunit C-like protein, partial [Leptotrombidium deliense]